MNRPLAVLGTVVVAGGMLIGCSHDDGNKSEGGDHASGGQAAKTSAAIDIAKIDTIKDQFPAGYDVESQPKTTVTQEMLDAMKGVFDSATFEPKECADQLLGAIPQVAGSTMQSVTGTKKGGETSDPLSRTSISAAAVETTQPIPEDKTGGKCDKFDLSISGQAEGHGEKIDAPAIEGVKTEGSSTSIKISMGSMQTTMDQVSYSAKIDDHHAVSVSGTGDVDRNDLADIFVKAVNAVRG